MSRSINDQLRASNIEHLSTARLREILRHADSNGNANCKKIDRRNRTEVIARLKEVSMGVILYPRRGDDAENFVRGARDDEADEATAGYILGIHDQLPHQNAQDAGRRNVYDWCRQYAIARMVVIVAAVTVVAVWMMDRGDDDV
tara:strand:- start:3497 stop:3928 length:432 start_codon:yes stop_codon:yes gene_type:complete